MMRISFWIAFVFVPMLAPGLSPGLRAAEPWIGTWKLNTGKSAPAARPPQSQVFTFSTKGELIVYAEDVVTADSVKYRVTSAVALDGKDYPVEGSRAGVESISIRRVDANTVDSFPKKKDGTLLGTYRNILSADGTTLIQLTWYGPAVSGPPNVVRIYDRQ